MKKITFFLTIALFTLTAFLPTVGNAEEVKIGVLFSITGPFAPAGALAGQRGSLIAIDMVNEKGGVAGKYKIKPIISDAQSNPDIAIREAERLISSEKVPIILGDYSSSIGVPLAPICEKNKTIFWVIIAISDKIVKDRHLEYTFRVQPMGSQWGKSTVDFINEDFKKFGYSSSKEVRAAVIYEDGPYGVSVSLILKLKAAKPDVIFHTGYFPDIVMFFKQGRELGLKTKAIIGHGAGYANFLLLEKSLGRELVNYTYNVDPAPAQILDTTKLKSGMAELIKEFLSRYNEKYGESDPPTHATQGFGHTWILLNKVMPLAVEKYGKITADTVRKAAREIDIPEGATPNGYGVKFATPDHAYAGQDLRSYPVVMQWVNGKIKVVWPSGLKTLDAKLPLPKDSPYAK
ncbi:MAG: hypothetical protein B6I32_07850 [Desulfobacterium sp. 4572_20]|nr:MAG: hypothetical protein B6I32_07850 [Desulfobacterium sp. 4572_20]